MAGSAPSRGRIIEGINVTPLVDIILVLLIIFIVTAKFVVTPAVPLDLPRATQGEEIQTILAVSLTANGDLYIDGEPAQDEQLEARAKAALEDDKEVRAVIQADGDVRHRRVIAVLDSLKSSGLARVAFGTVPDAVGDDGPDAAPADDEGRDDGDGQRRGGAAGE